MTIVPLGREFTNWRAAFESLLEKRKLQRLVIWAQFEGPEPASVVTHHMERRDMAFAALELQHMALEDEG
jgi:hypothetical protein